MDPYIATLLTLRSIGTLFALQGKPQVTNTINQLLAAHQAGKNVDDYMQLIADKLESGDGLDDWADIQTRINDEVTDFLKDPEAP